jgi:hypothetical protein
MSVTGVTHKVEKILMRDTTLIQASYQLKVNIRNYGRPKWWESQFREFRDFRLGSPMKNDIWV